MRRDVTPHERLVRITVWAVVVAVGLTVAAFAAFVGPTAATWMRVAGLLVGSVGVIAISHEAKRAARALRK